MLNEVFNEEKGRLAAKLNGLLVTMCVDGWTSHTGVPCIGITLGPHLISCNETIGQQHTGAYLSGAVQAALTGAVNDFHVQVVAIVTDSASYMVLCREQSGRLPDSLVRN